PITYRKSLARLNRRHWRNRAGILAGRCFGFAFASYARPAFVRSAAGHSRNNLCRAARTFERCNFRTRPGIANDALGFDSRFTRARHRHGRRRHSSLELAQSSRYRADRCFVVASLWLGLVFDYISHLVANLTWITHL